MFKQHPQEIAQELDKVNKCRNEEWRLWLYVNKNSKLVLCQFMPNNFLVFRGTTYIRLSAGLENAIFRFGTEEEKKSLSHVYTQDQHLISIDEKTFNNYIICQEVEFHSFQEE